MECADAKGRRATREAADAALAALTALEVAAAAVGLDRIVTEYGEVPTLEEARRAIAAVRYAAELGDHMLSTV